MRGVVSVKLTLLPNKVASYMLLIEWSGRLDDQQIDRFEAAGPGGASLAAVVAAMRRAPGRSDRKLYFADLVMADDTGADRLRSDWRRAAEAAA